jgi:uncharacterized protein YciI
MMKTCCAQGLAGLLGWLLAESFSAMAQTPPAPPAVTTAPAGLLFAVEVRTGPAWDAAKPPQEQAFFSEHSAHLRRLREQGRLVMGARYADKGLLVLRAASENEARALLQDDPSLAAGVFSFELHEFRVFYGGGVGTPPRPN